MADVEFAPLRPISDFLTESARFQVPDLKDPERLVNRILNNLLYYQSNYFISTCVVFLIVGVLHPVQMVIGIASVSAVFAAFVYFTDNKYETRRFKRDHPALCVAVVLFGGYIMVYVLGSVIVFLFGIGLPLLLVIMHAAMRMRNMKNKISNKIEFVGLKRTPMGIILTGLGQEQEAGS
ncbi:unnamed protein product [Owenia fusiformis]|uniref:PRA1 family protein n=1 Tax=Owenia fusiformis TaxID=6347 RepID=A0A8J1T4M3_OWEFU|nr:unnamed protein product [Owenia fusiformis]